MDELDLVRLTRPAVDEPGADALARLKAAALDTPTPATAVPPGDGDARDAPIELDVVDAPAPRRRRGLVLTSIAAAVLTVGGGIAIASRDRTSDRTAGSADTSMATDGGTSIDGVWIMTGGDLGLPPPPGLAAVRLSFKGDGGYGISVCTVVVGTSASVRDGRLAIDDTPTGVENGCASAGELAYQDRVVSFLRSRPTAVIGGNTLTLTNGDVTLTFQRQGGVDHTLDGRTFRITSLRDGDTDIPVDSTHTIGFVDGRVTASTGCNGMGGTVQSVGTTLVIVDLGQTLMACTGDKAAREKAMVTLLNSRPAMELTERRLRLSGGGVTLAAEETESPATTPPPATTASPSQNVLDGTTFTITKLVDGETDVPVEASGTLAFAAGKVRVKVGCNDAGGDVASADTTLVIHQLASTAAGCPTAEATAREALVNRLLTSRPSIQLADGQLRLAAGRIVLLAVDRDAATSATTAVPSTGLTFDALNGRSFSGPFQGGVLTMQFHDGMAFASVGCNDLQLYDAAITDGRLAGSQWSQTAKGCEAALLEREAAAAELLQSGPTVVFTGTTLTIASNGTRVHRVDLVEGPPLTLARSWVTNGRVQRGVLSYAGLQASLVLRADGSFHYDGCVNREGTYTADATTFTFTLVRPQQSNKPALDCTPEQRAEEDAFFADTDRPRTYAIDGDVLTTTIAGGDSEQFKAAS